MYRLSKPPPPCQPPSTKLFVSPCCPYQTWQSSITRQRLRKKVHDAKEEIGDIKYTGKHHKCTEGLLRWAKAVLS